MAPGIARIHIVHFKKQFILGRNNVVGEQVPHVYIILELIFFLKSYLYLSFANRRLCPLVLEGPINVETALLAYFPLIIL